MVEWVETTGRTVAEALEAALDQLGVDESDAEVVIVEEAKNGLFGLRKSEARVRARVRPTRPRPKRQQRDRRGRGRDGGGPRDASRADGASSTTRSADQATARSGAPGGAAEGVVSSNGASGAGEGEATKRRRRGGGRGAGAAAVNESGVALDDDEVSVSVPRQGAANRGRRGSGRKPAPERSTEGEEDRMSIEEQAQLAERFVTGVVECFGLGATTTTTVDDPLIEVAVTGDGLGILIGPHGSTLAALQELTRTVVQRRGVDHGTRIVVDVAGYRAKRAAALAEFAKSIAAEVLASGRPHSREPMSAADRKIVHDTVNEIAGVATSSEGEEEGRHVVIHLAESESGATAGPPAEGPSENEGSAEVEAEGGAPAVAAAARDAAGETPDA